MVVFRRGSSRLELVISPRDFQRDRHLQLRIYSYPKFQLCSNNFSIQAFSIGIVIRPHFKSIEYLHMQHHIMRSLASCQYNPHGCPSGRPGRSYRRYGSDYRRRIAGPTQPLGSWLDGLPGPEPDLASIRVLKNAAAQPACSNLHLSTEEAFGQAYQAVEHYQRSKFACLAPGKRSMYSTRDLPFMVFDQLDQEMFRSVLKGNVYMKWSVKMPDGIYATTLTADPRKRPRITIILSRLLSDASRADVLCTLIHQMMHAYFLQCCGYKGQDGGRDGHDLCHGPEFQALLSTISHRCSLGGPRQFTENLANPIPIRPGARRISARRGSPRSNWSNCYAAVSTRHGSTKIDDQNWRDMAIAKVRSLNDKPQTLPEQLSDLSRLLEFLVPVKDGVPPTVLDIPLPSKPRSPRPSEQNIYYIDLATSTISNPLPRTHYHLPPESYIELCFGSQTFPLPRDRIAPHLPGLAKSPYFTNKHILCLPSWSNQTDLVILYGFLLGSPSSSSPATNSDPAQLPVFPIINTYDPESTAMVKAFVSVFHIAVALEFRPLACYAIDTLHSLPYMRENPIAVLESIYHPPESLPQVPELQNWAKKWLAHRIPHADGWEDYAAMYPTNLSVVKEHPNWKQAYVTLRQRGTALVTDIDEVEAEIAKPQAPTSMRDEWLLKETKHPPVSGQVPSSTPFPCLFQAPAHPRHDIPASKDAQEEENWRQMRIEYEMRKRGEEEEARRKRKDEEGREIDNENEWEKLMRLKRAGNFVA